MRFINIVFDTARTGILLAVVGLCVGASGDLAAPSQTGKGLALAAESQAAPSRGVAVHPENAARRGVTEAYRDLLLLIQGPTVSVIGSPELCSMGAAPPLGSAPELTSWYFGEADCRLVYPPNFAALVNPVSERQSKILLKNASSRARLTAALDELIRVAAAGKLETQERLILQSAAWELAFGLDWFGLNDSEMQSGLEPAIRRAVQLLRLTQFSPEEARRLPATIADLPRLAAAPDIEADVKSLLAHDPGVVEVGLPTELHADLLFGRFTPRVFLTLADPAPRAAFRQYVTEESTRYEDLRSLPVKFGGLKGILVLYFNVLTADLEILPTEQVAFWYEYAFTGKAEFELPFNEAARRVRFLTIGFVNRLSLASGAANAMPAYRLADQRQMTRRGILDVKPTQEGERVNSMRAQCLRCHLNQVAAFDTHGSRRVTFSDPLMRSGRDLLTPYFGEMIESKLRKWARKYPREDRAEFRGKE